MRRTLACAALAVAALLCVAPALAQDDGDIILDASIGGRSVTNATDAQPVDLDPSTTTTVNIRVRNDSPTPVEIRYVRLEGRVIGLAFFSYTTQVGFTVPGQSSDTRAYELDLVGLEGQATGKIPARVMVLDADRDILAEQGFISDVQGSLRSVYGVFGLMVLALTAVFLVRVLLDLARGRLPRQRWTRALRFAVPGIGIGLTIVFSLSAFHVLAPSGARWWIVVVVSGVVFFLLGYATPTADDDDEIVTSGPLGAETVQLESPPGEPEPTQAWAEPEPTQPQPEPTEVYGEMPPPQPPEPPADTGHGEMPPPQRWDQSPPASQGWGEVPPAPQRDEGETPPA